MYLRLAVTICFFFIILQPSVFATQIFNAGGSFNIGGGFIDTPKRVWNPKSISIQGFDCLPAKVPKGKALLVTDMYLESDPLPPNAMLMALVVEDVNGNIETLRTLQIREPRHASAGLITPLRIHENNILHVLFVNTFSAPQAINWGINGQLVNLADAPYTSIGDSYKSFLEPTTDRIKLYPSNILRPLPIQPKYFFALRGSSRNIIVGAPEHCQFILNLSSGLVGMVKDRQNRITFLDQDIKAKENDRVAALHRADHGTNGSVIIDNELEACDDSTKVILLVHPLHGQYRIKECREIQIIVDKAIEINPGQFYQIIKE